MTAVLLAKWKDFLLHAFDPAQAGPRACMSASLHYGLLTLLSLTIVATLSAVGIILAVGLLIAPGAIAFLVARRFEAMLAVAVAAALVATFLGTYLSFFLDSAPAPTIILLLTAIFAVALTVRNVTDARRAGSAAGSR